MSDAATGGADMPYEYFDAMYSDHDDPWGFDTSWYERRKYQIALGLLPRQRYRRALEPGCSIGSFTELLAVRCEELVAFDFHVPSVDSARRRLIRHPHVDVRDASFPTYWPAGTGDLVVWSEVAYYLDTRSASRAIDGLETWLEPGGDVLAVHYTGATNYPRGGAEIGNWLDSVTWLERSTTCVDPSFEAGVWTRPN